MERNGSYLEEQLDIRGDDDLLYLLMNADEADVSLLINHLTDNGKGRASLPKVVREQLCNAQKKRKYSEDVIRLLIREIQCFGGNSFANIFRRNGVPYAEILKDVTENLGCEDSVADAVEELEIKLLNKVAEKAWENMSDEEKEALAQKFDFSIVRDGLGLSYIKEKINNDNLSSLTMAKILSGGFASVLGKGPSLGFGIKTLVSRIPLGIAGGVAGGFLTAAAGVYGLSRQAYRVTTPCVVQIAYIRQKSIQKNL